MKKPRVKYDITDHCDRWFERYSCSECGFVIRPETERCPSCKAVLAPYKPWKAGNIFKWFRS